MSFGSSISNFFRKIGRLFSGDKKKKKSTQAPSRKPSAENHEPSMAPKAADAKSGPANATPAKASSEQAANSPPVVPPLKVKAEPELPPKKADPPLPPQPKQNGEGKELPRECYPPSGRSMDEYSETWMPAAEVTPQTARARPAASAPVGHQRLMNSEEPLSAEPKTMCARFGD